ncbi:PTS system N-acetylglucosamine-specific IIC component [Elusimicrobium simillimum]|uniref:N-acetylglucosamine-specific PTS transporter subunit IIBC n=1 Tax=Elusimicrobium simillimum TaxID=3143438 RepID=UPI003C6F9D29
MKAIFSKVAGVFSTLGKALMLPIAVLPLAGLLLGISQKEVLDIPFLAAAGQAVFTNLPAIFALGVAIGFSKDSNGAAPLSAFVGYIVLIEGLRVLNPAVDMGVFAGIIMGILAGVFYNKFYNINLPQYLAFFGGKRFVPIVTGASAVVVAFLASVLWPPVQNGISALGTWIIESKEVGLFSFGFANRLLIPLGLHHILNNLVWFVFGDFTVVSGGVSTVVHGDLTRFMSGDPTAGAFMAGFFPVMMFGLPAACLAMLLNAKTAKRKATLGILASMAFTSFLTGITEPIEFSFMFLAFPLYLLHALLTGISMVVMDMLNIKLGFAFSAGLFDFVLNWNKSTNPSGLLIVGSIYAVVYFVVFYYAIKIWDLKTPGKEDDDITPVPQNTASSNPNSRGCLYLEALGGKENLKVIDNCATRLRLEVIDNEKVKDAVLKSLGARGVLKPGEGVVQVVIGPQADVIASEIKKEAGK